MRVLGSLTALLIAGEALALFFGIVLRDKTSNPWCTPLNVGLVGLDVLTGVMLFYALWAEPNPCGWLTWLAGGLGLLSHAFRVWQNLASIPNAFCAKTPLIIVNALKLAGLIITLIACIPAN